MKDYVIKEKMVEITLENDKIVRVSKVWVDKTMVALNTDIEDVLLMHLEDNGYIDNEEQLDLDKKAKVNGSAKIVASASDKPKKKTPKERVAKEYPEKELIINEIANILPNIAKNVTIENKNKIITFEIGGNQYKIDLTQKRKPKTDK